MTATASRRCATVVGALVATLVLASGCALLRRDVAPAPLPPLRVGTSADYPPFSYRLADGTLVGFDIDVARAYAADRGRSVVFVPFRWPELRARLLADEMDVAMSGVTVRGDRIADGVMTRAVVRSRAVLVAPASRKRRNATPSLADLDRTGKRIVVNRGGHLERVARSRIRRATIVTVDDNRALPCMLRDGSADAVVTDTLELASFTVEETAGHCRARTRGRRDTTAPPVVAGTLSHDRKAYWLTPRNAALAADLDEWLRVVERDGRLAALRARHFGVNGAPLAHAGDEPDASELDASEGELVDLVGRRLLLMPLVARAKHAVGRPIEDRAREQDVEAAAARRARETGLDVQAYRAFVRAQIAASKAVQHAALRDDARARALARERARVAGAAAPAADTETPSLEALRTAIDRLDAAILAAVQRAVPMHADGAAIGGALRRDGAPGLDEVAARDLADAIAALDAADTDRR